ncbi:MazG-like family protein [Ornithinimicrobium murale]|uniref:MazG-like family protein n=1 Tax=Ornithinimicrobium murale TaxID=1050153 RepID=UPI00192E0FF0|nr:MazG-like family protein [Ornithinimicrobium murale]
MRQEAKAAVVALSKWVDEANSRRDPEALLRERLGKVTEENGEVQTALTGWLGSNPRKGFTHTKQDVIEELLDVALAALGAVEHVHGNGPPVSVDLLEDKILRVAARAGVAEQPLTEMAVHQLDTFRRQWTPHRHEALANISALDDASADWQRAEADRQAKLLVRVHPTFAAAAVKEGPALTRVGHELLAFWKAEGRP